MLPNTWIHTIFFHDTNTFSLTDISQDFDDEYYSYLDKHYNKFDDDFSLIHMQKLTEKDFANEINNNVLPV